MLKTMTYMNRTERGCRKAATLWACVMVFITSLASCSIIDDDLSDCASDYQSVYELQLITNMTTELQTQLATEVNVSNALRNHLSGIFTDYAHDVDLSFYSTEGDSIRLHHDQHVMDANQASYTLTLPAHKYQHLALANLVNNKQIGLIGDDYCHASALRQTTTRTATADTVDSHTTGVFTALHTMDIVGNEDQTFHVRLFMSNCAVAFVLDPRGQAYQKVSVCNTGFATQFSIADSCYTFDSIDPIVRAKEINTGDSHLCFATVNFPSRETSTRTVIDTDEPFISEPDENTIWEIRVYVTNMDGTITETRLGVHEPLRGGQLKIVKALMNNDGSVHTNDPDIATSIKLDWKPGLNIET
jgi:hypothetical protein